VLVPFGAGSGVCGGIRPSPESIVVDLKRLDRIRALDREGLMVEAEGGIIGQHLEDRLGRAGLTLGHFPSSIYCSSLGGWLAGRSAGQCSSRYGKIEDMVIGLEAVGAGGELLDTGDGPDGVQLAQLLVGSEGVLAFITAARLRLHPAPAAVRYRGMSFKHLSDAITGMRRLLQSGLRPSVLRLYDPYDSLLAKMGKGGKGKSKGGEPERTASTEPRPKAPGLGTIAMRALLPQMGKLMPIVDLLPASLLSPCRMVVLFEGDEALATAEHDAAVRILGAVGGEDLGEGPARHWWKHRYAVSYRQSAIFAGGAFADTMEVACTWDRVEPTYHAVRAAVSRHVFIMAHFSHAYEDGCSIYFTFVGSAPSAEGVEALYDATWRAILDAAIGSGASLSHHHGVGRSKAPFMRKELGAAVDVVRALKRAADPKALMNPGTLIPQDEASAGGLTPAERAGGAGGRVAPPRSNSPEVGDADDDLT
jgi:alkyldihydroxyacetonephosphate synthase